MCHALQRGFIISEPLEYGLPQGAGICFHHIPHNANQIRGEPNGVLISVAFRYWHGRRIYGFMILYDPEIISGYAQRDMTYIDQFAAAVLAQDNA